LRSETSVDRAFAAVFGNQLQLLHCGSKTTQIWNGIARNYIERFWWRLAEIFKRL